MKFSLSILAHATPVMALVLQVILLGAWAEARGMKPDAQAAENVFRTIVDSDADSTLACTANGCSLDAICSYDRLEREAGDRFRCAINRGTIRIGGEIAENVFRAIFASHEEAGERCTGNTCELRASCRYDRLQDRRPRFTCVVN